jgi:hypothetical protein
MTAASVACDGLVYSIFPFPRNGPPNPVVVAFTSANSGEGVTYVVRAVMRAINDVSPGRTFQVDMDWLKRQPAGRSTQASPGLRQRSGWMSGSEYRRHLIQQLRSRFQFSGIDCPALSASSDMVSLAPLVDGVVLVVEADRTKNSQIRNAERQIEAAGGKVLGLVLNKRRYPVPESIYKLL